MSRLCTVVTNLPFWVIWGSVQGQILRISQGRQAQTAPLALMFFTLSLSLVYRVVLECG